jgi:hypothetical protein
MKKHIILSAVIVTLLLLPCLSACGAGGKAIPTGALPVSSVAAADDIVFTPGGGTYRANVTQEGQTNPWPPVPVAAAYWTKGKDTISVLYRPSIETKAGETHTDLLMVSGPDTTGQTVYKLEFYAADVPAGITITDSQAAVSRPGIQGTALVITFSPQIAPGEYNFKVGIKLDGKDYGTVPCMVTVTQ